MFNPVLADDDDFLDSDDLVSYRDFVTSNAFPWYFYPSNLSHEDERPDPHAINIIDQDGGPVSVVLGDSSLMFHFFLNEYQISPFFADAKAIFDSFCRKNGVEYSSIIRARINLVHRGRAGAIMPWHTDYKFEHKVFMLYLNDCDGDTVLYRQRYGDDTSRMEIAERISPKAGRGVVFDGLTYHSAGFPVESEYRLAINLVYI